MQEKAFDYIFLENGNFNCYTKKISIDNFIVNHVISFMFQFQLFSKVKLWKLIFKVCS